MISVKQLMSGAVMAGALVSSVCAVDRPVFKKMDQPVAWLKYDGGKYPSVLTYHPGLERVTNVLCGTNVTGTPRPVVSAAELEQLHPLCCWTKYSESNIQLEKFYKGYRESYAARGIERLLSMLGFTPNEKYKGTLLVDEYVNGTPQNWVIRSEDVSPVVAYLRNQFAMANIAPLATKPVLLLELTQANGSISTDDAAFLKTYYDIADVNDQEANTFFTNADKRKNDCFTATSAAHTVGSTVGEAILAKTVDLVEKVELKKVAVLLAGLIAADLASGLVKAPLLGLFNGADKKPNTTAYIVGGSILALILVPALMEYIEDIKQQAAQQKPADEAQKVEVAS